MRDPNKLITQRIIQEIQKLKKLNNDRIIITLDGTSATGKSSIANSLYKKMPKEVSVVHGDSMIVNYRIRYQRIMSGSKKTNKFYTSDWFNKNLKKGLKNAIRNKKPEYKFKLKRKAQKRNFEIDLTKKIIIIEGCFVSHYKNFGDLADLKVFIDMARKDIEARRVKRKEIRKFKKNNKKFVDKFDQFYKHYKENYKIIERSDLAIFAYYQ
jgi:uridine kinase